VKAFGGTITHEDNVPHGSIFTVDLPLQIVRLSPVFADFLVH
jgi:signal transduction histidine kinase